MVFPGAKGPQIRHSPSRQRSALPVPAASWTTAVRVDPTRKLIHDFRNTIQELVYAVERADTGAVAGLADCLDGYLLEALYGPQPAA